MATIVINAEREVLGRIASYAAKNTLMGNDVVIVNAEKAYVSGSMDNIYEQNLQKLTIKNKGNFNKGPYHAKRPDLYVRRSVRGMLPWKKTRGREAYKRIKVYIGAPAEKLGDLKVPECAPSKKLRRKVTVGEICKFIGGSW